MKEALVIGGSNGIGLAITLELHNQGYLVHVVDKSQNDQLGQLENIHFQQVNLLTTDFSFLEDFKSIDTLVITAGFGRIAPFDEILEQEIQNNFQVNSISVMKVLHFYFPRMKQKEPFRCAVMGSIAGLISSPLFATYGATKAAVCNGIESLNIELEMAGTENRILNVSPGSIKGTKFNGGTNDLSQTEALAQAIIQQMELKQTLYIPQYEEVFKGVLERYHDDPRKFGLDSYQYKLSSGRTSSKPQLKIGYLSGTFDLFHVGHLNLLRRAKECCDYLVVGIHKDASHKGKSTFISFEERCEIVKSIKYVDKVIPSEKEDCDVFLKGIVKYDYLFVGSDYKGTERFNRYEQIFADTDVKIIYFPYTQGTSSSQLREALNAIRK
ncbi:MAG: SDR family NAD(P)-dependent oxidoreductase [Bacteroidales bacterium]|jgi:glycerol-3-phosphate cytidylyltransferase|nr:SDR family NAD(P)-dependent oxidoreductase [Bacteroidales bacterium]